MEDTIDTHLFIDIILGEGVTLMYSHQTNNDIIEYYHGLNGRKVSICITDEFLTVTVAKEYLVQLGCASLIDRMFPSTKSKNI